MNQLNSLTSRPAKITSLMIIFTFLLAACAPVAAPQPAQQNTATPAAEATAPPAPTQAQSATSATVQVADNQKFGKILVDSNGMTLYTFDIDTPTESKCTSTECVAYWPPATVSTQPVGGSDVMGTLSTISRPDGSKQVTFDGKPLYTFVLDNKPGDATGDGVDQFGGIWHVVSASG